MIQVVDYVPNHLAALQLQPAQISLNGFAPDGYADWLQQAGPAKTVLTYPEGIVAILGVAEEWQGRAQCWALLSPWAGKYLVPITRGVRAFLDATGYRRIEAQTPQDFPEGRRWLRLLGFEEEGVMRNYYPDGRTAIRFARCSP